MTVFKTALLFVFTLGVQNLNIQYCWFLLVMFFDASRSSASAVMDRYDQKEPDELSLSCSFAAFDDLCVSMRYRRCFVCSYSQFPSLQRRMYLLILALPIAAEACVSAHPRAPHRCRGVCLCGMIPKVLPFNGAGQAGFMTRVNDLFCLVCCSTSKISLCSDIVVFIQPLSYIDILNFNQYCE